MVTLIISIFALALGIMALPTVFQMIYGKPDITVQLEYISGTGFSNIRCLLRNLPIKNSFLKKIGVHREDINDLTIFCAITDSKSNNFCNGMPLEIDWCNQKLHRPFYIPSSYETAKFDILIHDTKGLTIYFNNLAGKQLTPQEYSIEIKILYGEKRKTILEKFSIVNNPLPHIVRQKILQ